MGGTELKMYEIKVSVYQFYKIIIVSFNNLKLPLNRPKQSQISDSQIKKAPRSTLLEIEKQFYGLAVDLLSR